MPSQKWTLRDWKTDAYKSRLIGTLIYEKSKKLIAYSKEIDPVGNSNIDLYSERKYDKLDRKTNI